MTRAASWNFRAFGLFALELGSKYLWSDPTDLRGMCKLSFCPALQEWRSRTWLLRSQLRGAAWTVAVPRQARFAVLLRARLVLPRLLLCSPFLILVLLSWTHRSMWRTTQRNLSAHRCLARNLACHFAPWQSPVRLCAGAVILLTWFSDGACLFLIFTGRGEWLLYLQVWAMFNLNCSCQANDFLFFRFGTLPLGTSDFCRWEQDTVSFLNILGPFSTFRMIWYINTNSKCIYKACNINGPAFSGRGTENSKVLAWEVKNSSSNTCMF